MLCNCAGRDVRQRPAEVAARVADEALACANAAAMRGLIAMAAGMRAMAASNADELRERVDRAASLLERVGNAYQLASLFTFAAGSALGCGRDHDAAEYLERALPRARDRPALPLVARQHRTRRAPGG